MSVIKAGADGHVVGCVNPPSEAPRAAVHAVQCHPNRGIQPVCRKSMQDAMQVLLDREMKLTLHGL